MIAVTEKLAWYVSRASGLIAWVLVAASIVWGITLSSRLLRRRGIPAWLLDLHRYLGLLADHGLPEACRLKPELLSGINTFNGHLTCKPVADAHNLPFSDIHNLLA